MRPVRRGAAGAICLVMLTGCAGLPSTSTVKEGKVVSGGHSPEPLTVMPDGPLPDDDPRQIATGFLRAHMWAPGGYALARSFLSGSGSWQWRPGASVTVFGDETGLTATRPDLNTVRLRVPVIATLSSDGHLVRKSAPEYRDLNFKAMHSAAGWRLSEVPKDLGLWLSQDDFDRLYKNVNVYYPSAYGHRMVPDPRWLPRQGLATALARAALTRPPTWLAPAVHEPFPADTTLDVEAVPISAKGSADIDLSVQAQKASTADRSAMWASLLATVVQAPEVQSISVLSRGSRLEAENLPASVSNVSDVGYQLPGGSLAAVISRSGSRLTWTDPSVSTSALGMTPGIASGRAELPKISGHWSMVAAGPGGRQIAAVSPDRTSVRRWLNGTESTLGAVGTDLVRPSFDVFGFLWCGGRAFADRPDASDTQHRRGAPTVWALDTSKDEPWQKPVAVSVPWLGSSEVESMSLAPEGERMALVINDGGVRRAVVAAVLRDSAGVPKALGAPISLSNLRDPRNVVWSDAAHLAAIATIGGERRPVAATLDGDVRSLGQISGATELVATGAGESGLFVRAADGSVSTRIGAGWSSFTSAGDVIAPPS